MKNKTILLIFLIVVALIMFYISVKKCSNNVKKGIISQIGVLKDKITDGINGLIDTRTSDLQKQLKDKYNKASAYLKENKDAINKTIEEKIKEYQTKINEETEKQKQETGQQEIDQKAEDELELSDEVAPQNVAIIESSTTPTPILDKEIKEDRNNIKKYIKKIKDSKKGDGITGYDGDDFYYI